MFMMLCAVSAYGQTTLSVHVGCSKPFSDTYSNLDFFRDDYWLVGVSAGTSADFRLTSWAHFSPAIEYTLFPLATNYRDHGIHSADRLPPVYSGGGFNRLQLRIDCRLLLPGATGWIRPFLGMSGGYVYERISAITEDYGGSPAFQAEIEGESRYFWAYSLGFGTGLYLSRHLFIEPALLYHSSTDQKLYGLVSLKVGYEIEL